MDVSNNKKQYMMVFVITAAAVVAYLFCHRFSLTQPVIINEDKAVDNFIRTAALDGNTGSGLFAACELNIQNMAMMLLIKVCRNAWAGINIYYIHTFFMISFSMYLFLEKLEIPAAVSVGLAVMAAFLPFHIDRGEGQMMTSNFFLAPLFLCLFYDLIYCQKADVYSKKYIVLVCLAPFIDIRISVMAVLLFIVFLLQLHDWDYTKRIAWYPVLLFFFTGLVGIISPAMGISDIGLAKEEGMRILDLIMPMRYHISGRLSDMRLEYDILLSAHGESGLNSLGVLFSAGFVCMMLGLFFEWKKDKRIAWMGMISMMVILIAGICGIGTVIEYFGINVIYWSRMAVFITVCSVAVLGILIGKGCQYVEGRYGKKILAVNCAVVYVVFAIAFFELILRRNM